MAARKQGMFITIGSIVAQWYAHLYLSLFHRILNCALCSPLPWGGIYAATKSAVHAITNALEMECRPFNIKVLLVAPGGVKSNISANQTYNPPPDTLYAGFMDRVLARRDISQSSPMPTEVFAKRVVMKALAPTPPSYMTLGKMSMLFWILTWLPRHWLLSILWKRFGDTS